MTDKEKKSKIADILLEFYEEYQCNMPNRPMIPSLYASMIIDSMQEELKECMYSKGNYTDEDRKILCDGCEEDCEYNKKEAVNDKLGGINNALVQDRLITSKPIGVPADAIELVSIPDKKEPTIPDIVDEHYWEMLGEEPVSEDLEQAIDTYLATYFGGEKENQDWPFLKKMAIHFAQWQKKQMMASGTEVTVHIDAGGYPYIPKIELYDYDKDIPLAKEGDKYKVILIKED